MVAGGITDSAASLLQAPGWSRKLRRVSKGGKNELARLMTTEMRKTYRSRVDEAVKCCRVCRYYAENGQRFLADEVIQTTASKSYWLVFRLIAPGLGGGKCRLARARIERPAVGAKIEEVVLRSRLWRISKRPLPPASPQTLLSWRRLPMNSRGVSSRRLSLRHWR